METLKQLTRPTSSFAADTLASQYQSASPFPHIVIDHFFDSDLLHKIIAEFPTSRGANWKQKNHLFSKKTAFETFAEMGPNTQKLIKELNSPFFLRWLEHLTGIQGLLADESLKGGGLHQIPPGGFLKIHADFTYHSEKKYFRRLNLLLYLNEDWKEEYGGHIQLWDRQMRRCIHSILPVFNRMVIFTTDESSFHGHPEPLTCPPDRLRQSIALYYYTENPPHRKPRVSANTHYVLRPNETVLNTQLDNRFKSLNKLKSQINRIFKRVEKFKV